MSHRKSQSKRNEQAARAEASASKPGKVENDHNQVGEQRATQKNEGRRTPQSRSDRESQIGNNQSQARRGGPNSGVGGPR